MDTLISISLLGVQEKTCLFYPSTIPNLPWPLSWLRPPWELLSHSLFYFPHQTTPLLKKLAKKIYFFKLCRLKSKTKTKAQSLPVVL